MSFAFDTENLTKKRVSKQGAWTRAMSKFGLIREDAAEYLNTNYGIGSKQSLAVYASRGGGPVYRKIGRRAIYTIEDLDAWARTKMTPPRETATAHRLAAEAGEGAR